MEDRKIAESQKKNEEGRELLMKREYRKARQAFDEAIRLDPKNARAHSGKANALFGLEELEKAVKEMEKALELAPDDKEILDNYGAYLFNMGKHKEALGVAERLTDMIA